MTMGLIGLGNQFVLIACFKSQEKWVHGIYLKPTYIMFSDSNA